MGWTAAQLLATPNVYVSKYCRLLKTIRKIHSTRSVHMKQQMQQMQQRRKRITVLREKAAQERISKENFPQEQTATAALSFSEAIGRLPGQYIRVMLKPGTRTFSEEMRTAHWGVAL